MQVNLLYEELCYKIISILSQDVTHWTKYMSLVPIAQKTSNIFIST